MSTAVRPNGKHYTRRKPLEVTEFGTYGGDIGVVVLGTHDVTQAKAIAEHVLVEYDLDSSEPSLNWWRNVPWDESGQFDWSWINDCVRGTPCVVWEP